MQIFISNTVYHSDHDESLATNLYGVNLYGVISHRDRFYYLILFNINTVYHSDRNESL